MTFLDRIKLLDGIDNGSSLVHRKEIAEQNESDKPLKITSMLFHLEINGQYVVCLNCYFLFLPRRSTLSESFSRLAFVDWPSLVNLQFSLALLPSSTKEKYLSYEKDLVSFNAIFIRVVVITLVRR